METTFLVFVNIQHIFLVFSGADHNSVDSLAFETGIPKSIIQRYASLLSEHKRIILSGPTGTGKSHLAQHLAGYLISRYVVNSYVLIKYMFGGSLEASDSATPCERSLGDK